MKPQETSSFVARVVMAGLLRNELCCCDNCVELREGALGALATNPSLAALTQEQAGQLAHDVDVLRRMSDYPCAAVARPLRALGFIPALNDEDEQTLRDLTIEFRKANPSLPAPPKDAGADPAIMGLEMATLIAQAATLLLSKSPRHPSTQRYQALIAHLLYPEMDGPQAELQGVVALTDDITALLVRVRNAGAAGKIVGLSHEHQEMLKQYLKACRDLGAPDDDLPMIDRASLLAIRAAAPLAGLSAEDLSTVTAFLDQVSGVYPTPATAPLIA